MLLGRTVARIEALSAAGRAMSNVCLNLTHASIESTLSFFAHPTGIAPDAHDDDDPKMERHSHLRRQKLAD